MSMLGQYMSVSQYIDVSGLIAPFGIGLERLLLRKNNEAITVMLKRKWPEIRIYRDIFNQYLYANIYYRSTHIYIHMNVWDNNE